MLELKKICKNYDGKAVLCDLSFSVGDSEAVCITGPSGCGKTTLLRIAAGLDEADSGKRIINPQSKIAVLFQENRLLPWETAIGNLTAVGVNAERAAEYLGLVGLSGEENTFPSQLSGGMKRRLSLARMLAYGGDFYLFDEPLSGLDEELQLDILALIKREISGKAALIVSHNPLVPKALDARIFLLDKSVSASSFQDFT